MELSACAKINLTLDILRKREDGYHDLQMVMQTVTLADALTVEPAEGREGAMASDLRYLPADGRNLAQMAAAAFREAVGKGPQVDITIQKHIPVCAGLAGGSADAAAVLKAMNELTGAGLSAQELAAIGEKVGSDVPYCVLGGTALAEGRGELLTPLPPLPNCHVVLCKPPFPISTPQLFAKVNVRKIVCRPDTPGVLAALEAGTWPGWPAASITCSRTCWSPGERARSTPSRPPSSTAGPWGPPCRAAAPPFSAYSTTTAPPGPPLSG